MKLISEKLNNNKMKQKKKFSSIFINNHRLFCVAIFLSTIIHTQPALSITNTALNADADTAADHFTEVSL